MMCAVCFVLDAHCVCLIKFGRVVRCAWHKVCRRGWTLGCFIDWIESEEFCGGVRQVLLDRAFSPSSMVAFAST